jgi:hypothetical protein
MKGAEAIPEMLDQSRVPMTIMNTAGSIVLVVVLLVVVDVVVVVSLAIT